MPIYSHSRLSSFENCPLQFKFHYVDRVKTDVSTSIEAFMGDMVHQTLQKLYTDVKFQKVPSLKELHNFFRVLWDKNWNPGIVVVRKEYGPENYFNIGLKFISDYYEKYCPFNDGVTIGLESRVVINLDKEGEYKLQGFIDRLVCVNDTEYHIVDYKTNSHLKIQDQLDGDRQLALYQLAVMNDYRDAKKIVLKWHFLAFNKAVTSTRTNKQLEQLRKDTIILIKRIESTTDFRPNKSALCDWCQYRSICPEWSHLAKLECKGVNEYLKDSGVKLVNKYVQLLEKKRELTKGLDAELDKLKDALVVFAKREGVNVVFGSNNKIRVSIFDTFKFPAKGSAEREELIALLKRLRKWDEIADIDIYGLNKIMQDKLWNKEELDLIKKYAEKEEANRLYPSKMKKED